MNIDLDQQCSRTQCSIQKGHMLQKKLQNVYRKKVNGTAAVKNGLRFPQKVRDLPYACKAHPSVDTSENPKHMSTQNLYTAVQSPEVETNVHQLMNR